MLRRVLIIGRANVGKSTLFNKLIGERRSLVHDVPGVTRDYIEHEIKIETPEGILHTLLTDTGGLEDGTDFSASIQERVLHLLSEADVIVLLLDAQVGVTPKDRDIVKFIRKNFNSENVICAVNKVDDVTHEDQVNEFYSLGYQDVVAISAEHSRGIETILELTSEYLQRESNEAQPQETEDELEKIAFVGKPNAGKSTLVNALIKRDQLITSETAGTTTDRVFVPGKLGKREVLFIDTAGVRKKGKTSQGVEVLSVLQTKKALEQSETAVLVIDGSVGVTDQDEKISGLIEEMGCSVVLVVNKWDLFKRGKDFTQSQAIDFIRKQMRYLAYAPIVFVSAKEKKGLKGLRSTLIEVMEKRSQKMGTHQLTELFRRQARSNNPRDAKIFYCFQVSDHPPTIICHVNDPKKIHFSLKRNFINAVRGMWDYPGTPIRLSFKKKTTK